MNDEIKEKIDFIKQILNRNELIKCSQYFNDLLDYITNLQQENERLEENNQAMQEEMARVWEENERLNKGMKYLEKYFSDRQDYEYAEVVRQVKEANPEWNGFNE